MHIKLEENMPEKSKEIVTYIATTVLIKARISPSCIKHRIQQKLLPLSGYCNQNEDPKEG